MLEARNCSECGASFSIRRSSPQRCCSRACAYRLYARKKTRSVSERFWQYVRKTESCWLWTGQLGGTRGYGVINSGGKYGSGLRAHRVSWEIHNGPIPEGLLVCHHCDNPMCVRPDHLFLGDKRANAIDAVKKGIWGEHWPKGERHYKARVTDAQVREIRAAYAAGQQIVVLARQYGVSASIVSKIVRRVTWRHLE